MANRISRNEVKVLYPEADILSANLIICHGGGGHGNTLMDAGGYLVDASKDGDYDYYVNLDSSKVAKYAIYEFKIPYGYNLGFPSATKPYWCAIKK